MILEGRFGEHGRISIREMVDRRSIRAPEVDSVSREAAREARRLQPITGVRRRALRAASRQ